MKLIITTVELQIEFARLIKVYDSFYWASAWAGANSKNFGLLFDNKHKIKRIVIGIHFYQTHPDFIESFLTEQNVQFVNQPQGTFHPKLYLFYNSDSDWEVLVGSSNFTNEAFKKNTEANVLLHSHECNHDFLNSAFKLVNESWNISKPFSKIDLLNYRTVWNTQRSKIKSLSGEYGNKSDKEKPIYEIPMVNMSWKDFVERIHKEDPHGVVKRLETIEIAQRLFASTSHFNNLKVDERKFIAGVTNKFADGWAYFGSMIGRGDFVHAIIQNNPEISLALDQIPLRGQVIKSYFENFVSHFSKIFNGNYVGVASRLLAMKRPDVFYCITSKNQMQFCKEFNIKRSAINYEGYWEHIIEKLFDCEWWNHPKVSNIQEEKIRDARAAFLDALYYKG